LDGPSFVGRNVYTMNSISCVVAPEQKGLLHLVTADRHVDCQMGMHFLCLKLAVHQRSRMLLDRLLEGTGLAAAPTPVVQKFVVAMKASLAFFTCFSSKLLLCSISLS
jgi:hypothetical protein